MKAYENKICLALIIGLFAYISSTEAVEVMGCKEGLTVLSSVPDEKPTDPMEYYVTLHYKVGSIAEVHQYNRMGVYVGVLSKPTDIEFDKNMNLIRLARIDDKDMKENWVFWNRGRTENGGYIWEFLGPIPYNPKTGTSSGKPIFVNKERGKEGLGLLLVCYKGKGKITPSEMKSLTQNYRVIVPAIDVELNDPVVAPSGKTPATPSTMGKPSVQDSSGWTSSSGKDKGDKEPSPGTEMTQVK